MIVRIEMKEDNFHIAWEIKNKMANNRSYYDSAIGHKEVVAYNGVRERCGYTEIPQGGKWVTSGKNVLIVDEDICNPAITFYGRRHAFIELMSEYGIKEEDVARYEYVSSTQKGKSPFKTFSK